jgi:hypothetical protein
MRLKKPEQLIITYRRSFTPFPFTVWIKQWVLRNRLAICSFIYGCIGISFATWMMNYDSGLATGYWWKPSFSYIENMPAFVPIMFETVFCGAFNGYYFLYEK